MKFNVSKCSIMSLTKSRSPANFNYTMNYETIPRVKIQKYLGVTITSDLTWSNHISNICTKANKTLGLLRRTLHPCSADVKKRAYESLVRPNMEYATTAWSPHTKKDINKLENVQRSAARFVSNDYRRTSSVTSMILKVGWQTLQARRRLSDLAMFYKIQHGFVNISFPTAVAPSYTATRQNHEHKYMAIQANTQVYKNSYFVRTVPVWNSLPATAVKAANVAQFQAACLPVVANL